MDDPTPINDVLKRLDVREKYDNQRLKEKKKASNTFDRLSDPRPFGTYIYHYNYYYILVINVQCFMAF